MSKPIPSFGVGDRVSHFLYGPGTIAEIQYGHTTINFDENGRRKFVSSMVQLESTEIVAPAPPPKKSRSKVAKARK